VWWGIQLKVTNNVYPVGKAHKALGLPRICIICDLNSNDLRSGIRSRYEDCVGTLDHLIEFAIYNIYYVNMRSLPQAKERSNIMSLMHLAPVQPANLANRAHGELNKEGGTNLS
jgi:hypothetical protein